MAKHLTVREVAELKFFSKTGEVLGSSIWSETHVSSHTSGGGGYVYQGTGSISQPTTTVSSTVTERNRFFLRQAEGPEIEVDLSNAGFAVRDGHRVTVVFAGHNREDWGWQVGLHNHDTGVVSYLEGQFENVRGKVNAAVGCAAFAAVIVLAWMTSGLGLLVMIPVGIWLKRNNDRIKAIDSALRSGIDEEGRKGAARL